MRRCTFVLMIALVVATTGTVRAGVYCSVDQLPYPMPTRYTVVLSKLGDLRGIVNTQTKAENNPALQKYLKRKAELEAKEQHGDLTLDERIDLSGVYLRLNKNGEVIELLKQADQTNSLVLAHLAAAYFGIGYLDQAVAYEEKALAAWPEVSLRWSRPQLTWYRRAERYYLELLRLRQQEARRGMTVWTSVDALFPRLRFETADGRYEVGGPPAKQVERLQGDAPDDALPLVAQLVWWLPFDNRIYWLYGEVLNYRGDFQGAHQVFEDLGKFDSTRQMTGVATFMRHHREFVAAWRVWQNRHTIGYLLMPRGAQTDPGAADLYEVGLFTVLKIEEKLDDPKEGEAFRATLAVPVIPSSTNTKPTDPAAGSPAPPSSASAMWLPDWRTVLVSFGAGMLFMGLLLLQWREWSRRRGLSQPARRELTG